MTSESKETSKNGSGHLHAKLVDEAESVLRQFSLPVCSTSLIDRIVSRHVDSDFGPAQWSAYHQLVNVQRLQLESLFNCVLGFNDKACAGLKGAGTGHVRSDILRSILISLSSLMFLRMSTTITLATHGPYASKIPGQPLMNGRNRIFLDVAEFDSARLVNDEGLASLKADCELILKLITQLTAPPVKKAV